MRFSFNRSTAAPIISGVVDQNAETQLAVFERLLDFGRGEGRAEGVAAPVNPYSLGQQVVPDAQSEK